MTLIRLAFYIAVNMDCNDDSVNAETDDEYESEEYDEKVAIRQFEEAERKVCCKIADGAIDTRSEQEASSQTRTNRKPRSSTCADHAGYR